MPKPIRLEEGVAELLGSGLGIVEDEPAPADEIAVDIVEIVALQGDVYVAIVVVPGVVGVTIWLTGRIRGNAILCLPSLSGI